MHYQLLAKLRFCKIYLTCSSSIITTTDQTKTRENSTEFHQKNHKITNNNTIPTTTIITTNTVVYTLRMTTVEYESLSYNVLTKNQPRGGNLSEIENSNDSKSVSDCITWFIWD